jgi:hypothetical protein
MHTKLTTLFILLRGKVLRRGGGEGRRNEKFQLSFDVVENPMMYGRLCQMQLQKKRETADHVSGI